jgi:hypothetical protein
VNLQVPNFENLIDFAEWWINQDKPIRIPENPVVYLTDDATSTCIFRHQRFQVELYLIHPAPYIPAHEHPGVENVELSKNWNDVPRNALLSYYQREGEPHGSGIKYLAQLDGFALISIQKWAPELEMSSISTRWKGKTVGPKHEALIRQFNPDCVIYPGYADVTTKNISSEIL